MALRTRSVERAVLWPRSQSLPPPALRAVMILVRRTLTFRDARIHASCSGLGSQAPTSCYRIFG